MTTKQWLERGEGFMQEIKLLETEKNIAALQAAKVTRDISKERLAKTSLSRNDASLIKYADSKYIERIDKRLAELRSMLDEIEEAIYSVPENNKRWVLMNRYILYKSPAEIAAEMGYGESNVYKILGRAIKTVKVCKSV